MRIGLNQAYLFPYKGYFDLIKSVDKFVLYDDAQYIKGGWINRNYFPDRFTFRLAKHSSKAKINQCYFLDIKEDIKRFIKKFKDDPALHVMKQKHNLNYNIYLTIRNICKRMGIKTPIYLSSEIPHRKGVQGVIDIVKVLEGDTYVNLPGGKNLYHQEQFGNIKLEFIKTTPGPSILV